MNSNKMEIYVKNSNINLLETPTNITYIVLPNKTDNINTVWIMSNHWLKVLGYDLTSSSSALERHGIPKITLKDLNELASQDGYLISNPLKLPIRSTTQFMDVNSTKKILINSKQIIAQNIKSSDVDAMFEQINLNNQQEFDPTQQVQHYAQQSTIELTSTAVKRTLERTASFELSNEVKKAKICNSTKDVEVVPSLKSSLKEQKSIKTTPFATTPNKLQINNFKFGSKTLTFRYINEDDGVWFVGKDVASMLEYSDTNKALDDHVSDYNILRFGDWTKRLPESDYRSSLQNQTKLINEHGLYELIIGSKMPKAKQLQHWIISEVIPTCKGLISNRSVMNSETEKILSKNTSQPEAFEYINPKMIIEEKHMRFGEYVHTFVYIDDRKTLWFLSITICNILEFGNNRQAIETHVDKQNTCNLYNLEGVHSMDGLVRTHNIQPTSKFINEASFYQLIMKSKMPKAKEFQTWVTSDVLPSLRKTGHYSMQQASMNDAENLNTINRVIEGSNAAWFEEKIKLLEELREKDNQMLKSYQLIQEKDGKIIHLQQKAIELKPLVVSVPEKANKFHVLELFSIRPKDGFMYGYFCSRRQQCTAMDARPLPEEEPVLLFSIKCANAINAYNCVKEELRSILNKCFITILNKRFYCNVNNENVIKLFENALSIKF